MLAETIHTKGRVTDAEFDFSQGHAWRAWRDFVAERQEKSARLHKGLGHWLNRSTKLAFSSWLDWTLGERDLKEKAAVIVGRLKNSNQVINFQN